MYHTNQQTKSHNKYHTNTCSHVDIAHRRMFTQQYVDTVVIHRYRTVCRHSSNTLLQNSIWTHNRSTCTATGRYVDDMHTLLQYRSTYTATGWHADRANVQGHSTCTCSDNVADVAMGRQGPRSDGETGTDVAMERQGPRSDGETGADVAMGRQGPT